MIRGLNVQRFALEGGVPGGSFSDQHRPGCCRRGNYDDHAKARDELVVLDAWPERLRRVMPLKVLLKQRSPWRWPQASSDS
jgi:hypothetical protein